MKFNSLLKFAPWFVCICCLGIRYALHVIFLEGVITNATDMLAVILKVDNRVSLIRTLFSHSYCVKLVDSALKDQLHEFAQTDSAS